ncbi:MAG TPA: DUF4129 domain-containing protein [Anaerolineae bacterium]|mgnify:CR=1 FL=1|nr:DUF4129 domain-containing protein [Anaerolineae bacterium]HQH38978.1 DUF4129 domain-containing protein [Anaerolineae bacterium]
MAKRRKFWILIAASVAIVALLLLAASLTNLELLPGEPFPWGLLFTKPDTAPLAAASGDASALLTLLRIVMGMMLLILVIYMVFTKEGRKRALRIILQFALFMLLMSFVLEQQTNLMPTSQEIATGLSPLEEMPFAEPPEFIPGDMRDLTNTLSLVLAIVLTVVILGTLYILWRRRRQPKDDAILKLAREAQDALDAIQSGGNVKNAVIRCYVEMSRVISEKRNIQRGQTMTSHEFEEHLIKVGFPQTPIRQLTHLFEEARYGDRDPGPAEEQRAVACLSAIVAAATEASQ